MNPESICEESSAFVSRTTCISPKTAPSYSLRKALHSKSPSESRRGCARCGAHTPVREMREHLTNHVGQTPSSARRSVAPHFAWHAHAIAALKLEALKL